MPLTTCRIAALALALCLAGAGVSVAPAFADMSGDEDRMCESSMSISEAQAILQHAGYLAPDGYAQGEADLATVAAVRSFQRAHTLLPTGALDYETMTQLWSHSDGTDSARTAARFAWTNDGQPAVLEGVRFDTDTARLTLDSHVVLDRVARSLKASPDVRVTISGYADSRNTDAHNLQLSKERAEAVCEYLAGQGVDGSRLVARGYGETNAIGDNGTASGRAMNRRVEMTRID
jgi:outer membrane protein OmpA-like peptidoglycan-associated protein